jgi:hypothetical protein
MRTRLFATGALISCALAICPNLKAQWGCSALSDWNLRGTWSISGSGWKDLSKIAPTLPPGMVPIAYVGIAKLDGMGAASGWLSMNLGGQQVSVEFINFAVHLKPDCTALATYSYKIKELGITAGPEKRLLVLTGDMVKLQYDSVVIGTGPSTSVDSCVVRRIFTDID